MMLVGFLIHDQVPGGIIGITFEKLNKKESVRVNVSMFDFLLRKRELVLANLEILQKMRDAVDYT
jgi:hypothetical protein